MASAASAAIYREPMNPVPNDIPTEIPRVYKPTLGLVMIVKNEAENLPSLLGPVKDKFDELVIVDTGSTDGTPEIAREYGAKVFFFPWINDFAAARNESIRRATADWLIWLDGDDRMSPDEIDRARKLIERHPNQDAAFYFHLRSLGASWSGDQNLLQIRLFPRIEGVEFRSPIHERLTDSLAEKGVRAYVSPVEVIHTGYMDEEAMPEKYRRNLLIMDRLLQEQPDDLHVRFQLIMQLLAMKENDRAIREITELEARIRTEVSEEHLDKEYRFLLLQGVVYLNAGLDDRAAETFRRITEHHPTFGVGHYFLALCYKKADDFDRMHEHLVKAEYHGVSLDALPMPVARVWFDIASMMGIYYQKRGRWMLAAQKFREALRIQEDYLPYYLEAGNCYLQANQPQRAGQTFEMGIVVHDRAVARVAAGNPAALESGTEYLGTVIELAPAVRAEYLAHLYDGWARALMVQNRMDEAGTVVERASERLPGSGVVAAIRMVWGLQTGRFDAARDATERLLHIKEPTPSLLESLANLHLQHRDFGGALPLLKRLWTLAPDKWDALLIAALLALQTGQGEFAGDCLRQAKRRLIESGVAEATAWPDAWTLDHPILAHFSKTDVWASRSPNPTTDGETEHDPAARAQRARAFAEKLAAVSGSIREALRQIAASNQTGTRRA